jgi:hypothetical protein
VAHREGPRQRVRIEANQAVVVLVGHDEPAAAERKTLGVAELVCLMQGGAVGRGGVRGGGKGSGEWGGSGMWRAVRGGLGSAICQRTTAAALRPQAGDGLAALEAHLPNAVVRAVTHKQVLAVRRQTARVSEYALAVMALDRQPQLALRVEDLDAIVVAICNHNAPIRQRHNMRRTPEADQDCHRRDGGAHVVGFRFG